jgi:hypothetical protein
MQFLVSDSWAKRHFGDTDLGDERRTRRLVRYAAAAAGNPSASIPNQCGCPRDIKGAYRLFDNEAITHAAVIGPHLEQTAAAARQSRVVLHISDTTTLSFAHPHTQGLGSTSNGGQGQGLLLHNTLAIDVSGGIDASAQVLGLSHQQIWARTPQRRKAIESDKWPTATHAIGPAPAGVRYVHVSDAESDCWEALAAFQSQGVGHVIRACQDRCVSAGDDPHSSAKTRLFEYARIQAPLGGKLLWTRRRGDQPARQVKLLVSATQVTIHGPKNGGGKKHRSGKTVPLVRWVVRVWESNPPAGHKPIEWVLLSDEPVTDLTSALRVAYWYSCRWLVEEYHKCLKTGCSVESRQLQHVDRLEPLVGVLSVVAVRLLQLKHQAKATPDAPAQSVVPQIYARTLAAHLKISPTMAVRRFWREIAQLGGFLGRKSDGEPGWQTLWRGWWQLELLVQGVQLAKHIKCG